VVKRKAKHKNPVRRYPRKMKMRMKRQLRRSRKNKKMRVMMIFRAERRVAGESIEGQSPIRII
jgi:hypothetical protein